jgi:hypothetical protein
MRNEAHRQTNTQNGRHAFTYSFYRAGPYESQYLQANLRVIPTSAAIGESVRAGA